MPAKRIRRDVQCSFCDAVIKETSKKKHAGRNDHRSAKKVLKSSSL